MEGDKIMQDKKYSDDLILKRINKGGGLAPIVAGLNDIKQQEVQMIINEQWLEGYKTAKKKYKNKR